MSLASLRILLLVLVFAAALLAAQGGLDWWQVRRRSGQAINARLNLIARGYSAGEVAARLRRDTSEGAIMLPGPLYGLGRQLDAVLRNADIGVTPIRLLSIMLLAWLLLFLGLAVAALVVGSGLSPGVFLLVGVFSSAVAMGLPLLFFARRADRRQKKLVEQFPVALDIFVRGLRAGHPVASALDLLTQEMSDPIGSEFGLVTDEVNYGAELREALHNMAERCDLDDMRMFVVSLSVQNETGGNLAEILENLAAVIRERSSMVLMVRALSSEGRMTGAILTALPVLAFTALFLLNPPFYLDIAGDPAFIYGFGGLIILYFVGFVTIRRMIDLKV